VALSAKMLELQKAMDFYGDTTLRNFQAAQKFGDEIIHTMEDFLGEGAKVFGVNPEGEWDHKKGDHRGAKYSTYHTEYLGIEPILMGVAIRIPHSKDSGAYWIRILVEMEFIGDAMNIQVGDKVLRSVPLEYSKADVEKVQEQRDR
jgi:hypothetical protein